MRRQVAWVGLVSGLLLIGGVASPAATASTGSRATTATNLSRPAATASSLSTSTVFANGSTGTSRASAEAVPAGPESGPRCVGTWQLTETESPGTIATVLLGVAAVSADDGWAVGHRAYLDDQGLYAVAPVIERWTGTEWTLAYRPSRPGQLAGVIALARDDVWAVGHSGGPETDAYQPMIMHWDGDRWRRVKSPRAQMGYLLAIGGSGPDDLWTAGTTIGRFDTLVQHWDGTRWRKVRHPAIESDYVEIGGVAATRPDEGWIVGSYLEDGVSAPLALRWDGSRWRRTDPVRPDDRPTTLRDVSIDDHGRVWAVGHTTDTSGSSKAVIQRWTGTEWEVVPAPDGEAARLDSVSAGPQGAWAVGSRQTDESSEPVIMKWRRGPDRWSEVTAPGAPGDNMLLAIDQTTHSMFAVGFHRPEEQRALALRRC